MKRVERVGKKTVDVFSLKYNSNCSSRFALEQFTIVCKSFDINCGFEAQIKQINWRAQIPLWWRLAGRDGRNVRKLPLWPNALSPESPGRARPWPLL